MRSKHVWIVTVGMLLLVTCSASHLLAADDVPELSVEKVEVTAYDRLIVDKDDTAFDVLETLALENKIFLRVDMYISPKWTETAKKAEVNSKEIVLVGEDESSLEMAGYFKYTVFYQGRTNFSVYRPNTWDKEEFPPFRYNAVFIVPADSTTFTFQLGSDASAPIEVPAVQSPPPDPRMSFTTTLEKMTFSDELVSETNIGGEKRSISLVPGSAKFLEIGLNVMPHATNAQDQRAFFVNTQWFGLMYDGGYYASVVGVKSSDGTVSKIKSYTMRMKDDAWSPEEMTVCFAVPEGIRDFTLTYLKTPIIEGTMSEDGSFDFITVLPPDPDQLAEEVPPELIKKVQTLLTLIGYDAGVADGKMGMKTITAIKAFQKDENLAVDGKLTRDVLEALKEKL